MRLHTFAATLAFVGLSGSFLFAGGRHAKICKRKAKPYHLELQALRGKTTTDVEIAVSADPGWERPTWAKHIYLKGSLRHKHAWKRALHAAPLEDGRISVSESNAVRGASVSAEVRVRTCTCGSDQAMKKSTTVLFRPDLEIAEVHAPAQVRAKEPVNVEIVVRESKGDLGATFGASLAEHGAILDEVTGAAVDPAGTTSLIFTLAFDEPGIHPIAAKVGNVKPGEYDEANNAAAFQIEVLPAIQAVEYRLIYRELRANSTSNSWNEDSATTNTYRGSREGVTYFQFVPQALTWPLQDFSVQIRADGTNRMDQQVSGVEPTTSSIVNGTLIRTTQVYWPDEQTWGSVYSYSNASRKDAGTLVRVDRFAGDEVWTSIGYRRYWGFTYGWKSQKSGKFLHARTNLAARVTVADHEGRTYGGWGSLLDIRHTYTPVFWAWSDGKSGVTVQGEQERWEGDARGTTIPK